ncbi:N-alpha-acetyltransferase 35, NatC auxiliary subunit-like isoform X2 [Symsagittifera roscoffensis]|uniref:N-alpha-acetyltransferase 35, NatC auxiliary subunit-like isoform X2 n=1 Tax=Symsagittifera roscoffensis TaxID=84072 RepID=UPI00307C2825
MMTFEGEDITEKFLASCEHIQLGKLIHCPNFTLFEAMSGIELMDSKMDSGLLSNKVLLNQLKAESDSSQLLKTSSGEQLSIRLTFIHSFIASCSSVLKGGTQQASNDMKKMPQLLEKTLDKLRQFKQTDDARERDLELVTKGICKVRGFDENLNQHLLPPTFPKAAAFASWTKMHDYFTTTLTSFKESCQLFSNSSANSCTLSTVLNFVSSISSSAKSNLLERSIVQCVLFHDVNCANAVGGSSGGGSLGLTDLDHHKPTLLGVSLEEFMAKSISCSVSHLAFTTTGSEEISKLVSQFLSNSTHAIVQFIKCYGKNRSRLREQLIRVNQELFHLEPLCIALDNALNSHYPKLKTDKTTQQSQQQQSQSIQCHRVYSWLSVQASNVMQQFIYMGFELELYSEHELIYIFWYLADFLLIWSCSLQKERLEKFSDELMSQPKQYQTVPTSERPFFKVQRRDHIQQNASGSSNQKKNKQQQKQMRQKEIEMATQSAHLYEIQAHNLKYLQSLLSIFCGFYKCLVLLKAAAKLPVVEEKCFDNEKLRFERRIAPIALDADFFPSYEMFCAAVSGHTAVASGQPRRVLQQAAESFSDAKTLLSDIRGASNVPHEVELMFKVSSNNLIVLNLILQKWPREEKEENSEDFRRHLQFKIEFHPQYSNWPVFKLDSR